MPPEKVSSLRSAASLSSNLSSRSAAVCPGSATWRNSPISTRFSRPVSTWSTAADCPVTLICSRTLEGCFATFNPATLAVPPSALINVVRMLIVVVLPEPLAPSRAKTVPRATVNETSWSTGTPLYPFTRFLTSMVLAVFSSMVLRYLLVDSELTSVRSEVAERRPGANLGCLG
jgi:hypothetical protein